MASPDATQLLQLYEKAVPAWFFEEICQQQGYRVRQGVYSFAVVVWLMISQRLRRNRTLAAAVQGLLRGQVDCLLSRCKRVQQRTISARAAGYCQARQKLPGTISRGPSNPERSARRRLQPSPRPRHRPVPARRAAPQPVLERHLRSRRRLHRRAGAIRRENPAGRDAAGEQLPGDGNRRGAAERFSFGAVEGK